jgi:Pyruvate/2-oxoacid:ferredoxin oxidoreductase delta subunit
MAHLTVRSAYKDLVDRINKFPQGAAPSELLYKILELLFSEREAEFVALLPIKPFTAKEAAYLTKRSISETIKILNALSSKGILLDIERDGQSVYTLPPPMAGFFEFSMMRIRGDINQTVLAELFYQYLNVEEEFIKQLFTRGKTQLGRTFVNEESLPKEHKLEVFDYEKASEVIKSAKYRAVGICYCRHKMDHLGKACNAPMEICLTFNSIAGSLIKHNIAREIDLQEGLDLLQTAYDKNLVQFGENVREEVSFICNCCGCCCEAMLAAKRFGLLHPVHTTNYLPSISAEDCSGCGKCVNVCPVEAVNMVSVEDIAVKKRIKKPVLNEEICLGCGLCVRACTERHIQLVERKQRVITPLNSAHKAVVMAIERGKFQNLIFDQQALWNHRVMAAILGIIIKLPPIKQVLASNQLKSRYLEYILTNYYNS